jgi:hypothetical protein
LPGGALTIPLACGVLAAALGVIAVIVLLRPQGWSLTALPRVDAATLMGASARARDPHFHVVHPGAYDGQFYWGVAVDPLARGDVHQGFDVPSYRYGHPLYGWLAWLLSAGQDGAVPAALAVIGILSLFAAAFAAGLLGRGWEGLFAALNPGLLLAAANDLTEPLAAALLAGSLLAYVRGRRALAVAGFVLLCFAKEPLVAVPVAIAAWEVLRRRATIRGTAPLVLAPLPVFLWWIYDRVHLGDWPFHSGDAVIGAPLAGWRRALVDAGVHMYDVSATVTQLAEAHLALLVAVAGLFLVTGVLALRLRTPFDAALVPLVAVVAILSPDVLSYPKDVLRAVSVPLVLVPFVIRRRAPAATPTRP